MTVVKPTNKCLQGVPMPIIAFLKIIPILLRFKITKVFSLDTKPQILIHETSNIASL